LIDWCFTARQHKIGQFVPIYQGGLLAPAVEDSQRRTNKNIQLHAIRSKKLFDIFKAQISERHATTFADQRAYHE